MTAWPVDTETWWPEAYRDLVHRTTIGSVHGAVAGVVTVVAACGSRVTLNGLRGSHGLRACRPCQLADNAAPTAMQQTLDKKGAET